jgi:hypothetical protein
MDIIINSPSEIQGAFARMQQQSCTHPPYSPFGCDQSGNPIEYAVVQGFAQAGYGAGMTNCQLWDYSDPAYTGYNANHCGIDIVSYSDPGWLAYKLNPSLESLIALKFDDEVEWGWFDLDSFNFGDSYPGNWWNSEFSCITREQFNSAMFKYRGYHVYDVESEGRKVYALHSGVIKNYEESSFTLTVEVNRPVLFGITLGNRMWVQYTHLIVSDVLIGQPISAGEYIGHYGYVGYTTNPHLHISYLPIGGDALRQELLDINCPQNMYLNPTDPFGNPSYNPELASSPPNCTTCAYGWTGMWVPPRRGRFPEHISSSRLELHELNAFWTEIGL